MTRVVLVDQKDGNGVGIFDDAPVPAEGDTVEAEGAEWVVVSRRFSYSADETHVVELSVRSTRSTGRGIPVRVG